MSRLFARAGGALMAVRFCCLLVLVNSISLAATLDLQAGSDTSLSKSSRSINLEIFQQELIEQPHSGSGVSSNRRLLATCTGKDISISQGQTGFTSNGIPQFRVQIVNLCSSSCAPWSIHLCCGSFASATLVNPNIFKRLAVNDCLVNNGNGLQYGNILSFTYANSAKYSLSFRSMQWC